MYDVKSYYNQAKNMVLNLSEMEAKVAEATNDDPWYVPMLQYQSYGTESSRQGRVLDTYAGDRGWVSSPK